MSTPFHSGDRQVQRQAGVDALAERIGRSIRAELPDVARAFLGERRFVLIGSLDDHGRPWASMLTGARGFVEVLDPQPIRIDASLAPGDPLTGALHKGAWVGLIALDLQARRRLRFNGRVVSVDAGRLVVAADQVYANCPKSIQRRDDSGGGDDEVRAVLVSRAAALSDAQRGWLRSSDTFFVATANPGEGADTSHRGGMPRFVGVEGNRIVWPDYAGNAMFNTLGNIAAYPRAGLLVANFDTGAILQITGRAAIDWTPARVAAAPAAARPIRKSLVLA
jgi:uncharacterized protein